VSCLSRFTGLLVLLSGWQGAALAAATADGQVLAFARDKGNCLACHVIAGGSQMGDIGPPLADMRQRFPDRARLVAQLWDPGRFNERSMMPPYGRHEILTAAEIEAIVDYLYSL
jgi:sulfur-oxidizing protein SoxX